MADFYQNGIITTLHNLDDRPISDVESELVTFSKQRPMGLILPSLFSELEGEAIECGTFGTGGVVPPGVASRLHAPSLRHALWL